MSLDRGQMAIIVDPPFDVDRSFPEAVPETEPRLQPNRWRYRFPWVKTAVGAPLYDNVLLVINQTNRSWLLHHGCHCLGTIAPLADRRFRLVKSGIFTAIQMPAPADAEYIVVQLKESARAIRIVDIAAGEGFFALELVEGEESGGEENPPDRGRGARRLLSSI